MFGARWTALVVAFAVGAVGCGGDDEAGSDVTKITVVTPGARADADVTRQATTAAKAVGRKLHVAVAVVDAGETEVGAAVERAAATSQLVVVPHEGDQKAAVAAAAKADVPVLTVGDDEDVRAGLVGVAAAADVVGAYGAGVLAMKAALFRSAGIVVCGDADPAVHERRYRMAAAFAAGAASASRKARVDFEVAGSDADSARHATRELLDRRIQMTFALCGDATAGAMRAINASIRRKGLFNREVHLIGAIGDKSEINGDNTLLTSVVWDPAPAIEQAIRDLRSDRYGRRAYALDLSNGGISLLATGRTPGDAHEAGVAAVERVAERPDALPDVSSEAELQAYIADL